MPRRLRERAPTDSCSGDRRLSVIGDRITPVAIAFAVLGLGSVTDLGIVMAAGGVPFALFALAAGVWADRVGLIGNSPALEVVPRNKSNASRLRIPLFLSREKRVPAGADRARDSQSQLAVRTTVHKVELRCHSVRSTGKRAFWP